nr:amicyanin [uncultured Gellertiella sp.]
MVCGARISGLIGLLAVLAAAPLAAAEHVIAIDHLKFGTVPQEVHPGDVIVWRNLDIFRHTATAGDHAFDIDLPPKQDVRMVVKDLGPGDHAFFCRFHPGMKAVLKVAN